MDVAEKIDAVETVRQFYDANSAEEWERLERHPAEFYINSAYLARYIHPGDKVLDLGGGPGRYALWLAERGCDVTLADLSQGNVDFALAKAQELNLPLRALQADARDPAALAGETFDHVLLMGPLYHLQQEADRARAVESCLALLKPGGTLSVAFIAAFAGIIFAMKALPEAILDPKEQFFFDQVAQDQAFAGLGFTEAYFARPAEVLPFMARFPLETLHLLGSESILAPNQDHLLAQPPEVLEAWLQYALRFAERPEYLCFSEHLLYMGRKR